MVSSWAGKASTTGVYYVLVSVCACVYFKRATRLRNGDVSSWVYDHVCRPRTPFEYTRSLQRYFTSVISYWNGFISFHLFPFRKNEYLRFQWGVCAYLAHNSRNMFRDFPLRRFEGWTSLTIIHWWLTASPIPRLILFFFAREKMAASAYIFVIELPKNLLFWILANLLDICIKL